jgi:hypothetical protein
VGTEHTFVRIASATDRKRRLSRPDEEKFEREATLLISKIWRAKSTDCY